MRNLLLAFFLCLSGIAFADGTATPTTTCTSTPSPTPVQVYIGNITTQYQQYSKTLTLYYGEPARFSVGDFEGMESALQINVQVQNTGASVDVKLNSYDPIHLGHLMLHQFSDMGKTDLLTWNWDLGDAVEIKMTWWAP